MLLVSGKLNGSKFDKTDYLQLVIGEAKQN